ncbi:MAG TPA: response regulator transcription factor [Nitrospira sp.]|nr:response regulator transcription factor [Nitrospira sp.]
MMAVHAGALIKITIVSGQHLVWAGLHAILESTRTFQIVGTPTRRITATDTIADCQPDVIIVDTETEQDAIEGIRQLREAAPHAKMMLLSGFEQKDPVREALEFGVDGVILKINPPAVIIAAIEALFPPSRLTSGAGGCNTAEQVLPRPPQAELHPVLQQTGWPDALTEREREVIRLVKQGLSNKDIAHQLSISDSTVRHHLTSIFDKVGVPNRQKLMVHAHHFRTTPV